MQAKQKRKHQEELELRAIVCVSHCSTAAAAAAVAVGGGVTWPIWSINVVAAAGCCWSTTAGCVPTAVLCLAPASPSFFVRISDFLAFIS